MNKTGAANSFLSISTLLVFVISGIAITCFARQTGAYSEITDNYNLMWLDAWCLAFIFSLVLIWRYTEKTEKRNLFVLLSLAVFGVVSLALIFAESQFPERGYWGDQKFRMTMIEQFSTTALPGDYYYKNLPVFYPPILYYLLSLVARLFNMEAYEVLRITPHIIFAVLPFLLYVLWRNILSAPRALFVTCAVLLVDVGGAFAMTKIPHAFIANSIFVPWWLHYLEGIGTENKTFRHRLIVGSIIGALLFSTYFYPYFVIAFMMPLLTVYLFFRRKTEKKRLQNILRGWSVLIGAALLSAPHWFPVMRSVAEYGMDRSRADWYHSGTPGLNFLFLDFTWLGVFFLAALVFLLFTYRSTIQNRILTLLGFIFLFVLFGSVMGAFDRSLNLTKVNDFILALAGPSIGLALFALYRWSHLRVKRRWVVSGLLVFFLFIMVQGMNGLFLSATIVQAKKTAMPNWGIPQHDIANCKHKVFLAGNEEMFAFFPAYSFIAMNEHYSHPASRFIQRYDFLNLLQRINDPYLFNLALRKNMFDTVDYLMPNQKEKSFLLASSISNYPDKLVSKTLTYPCTLLENNPYFRRLQSQRYIFEALPTKSDAHRLSFEAANAQDSASRLNDFFLVYDRLNAEGKAQLLSALSETRFEHESLQPNPAGFWFEDRLVLIGCHTFSTADSVYLFPTFRVNRQLPDIWRVYLHASLDSDRKNSINFDFPPDVTTETWTTGDVVTLSRVFPRPKSSYNLILGFFNQKGEYGQGFLAYCRIK